MRRVAFATVVLLLAPLGLPVAPAATFLTEGWEAGTAGWTITGAGGLDVDCGWGSPGCSLRSLPAEHTEHAATRALDMPIPTATTLVVEMRFYNNLTSNSMSPSLQILFDDGYANLSLNRGETETLQLLTKAGATTFGHYERFEWYTVQMLVRGDKVMARFAGPDAPGFWDSATLSIPGATKVTGIRIHNSYYEPWRETLYYFDAIRVYDVPTCFPFGTSIVASRPFGEWPLHSGLKPTVTGGHALCPASWSIDFDDGTPPATGVGLPPAIVPHNYTAAGGYEPTYTLTVAGETLVRTIHVTVVDCMPLWPQVSLPATEGDAPFHAQLAVSIGSSLDRCAASWTFDPGDGSPALTGVGTAPVISHVYASPGVREAHLSLARADGSASVTRILAAGPYEERANGSFLVAATPVQSSEIDVFHTRVDLGAPTDGSDRLRLSWTSLGPSHIDVGFRRGELLVSGTCEVTGTNLVEGCVVPRGADAYVVAARTGALLEWEGVVTYA